MCRRACLYGYFTIKHRLGPALSFDSPKRLFNVVKFGHDYLLDILLHLLLTMYFAGCKI